MSKALILTRAEVAELLSVEACADAIERAFMAHAEGRTLPPAILGVPAGDGRTWRRRPRSTSERWRAGPGSRSILADAVRTDLEQGGSDDTGDA